MTTTALLDRGARSQRRARLLALIARATEELVALERAERHSHRLAAPIVEPPEHEVALTLTQRARAWAYAQGMPCGRAGRLPEAVLDAYAAAHPEESTP